MDKLVGMESAMLPRSADTTFTNFDCICTARLIGYLPPWVIVRRSKYVRSEFRSSFISVVLKGLILEFPNG